ncbi:MAG: HEAT repeat domain-containing protein, partial [Gammaproteobacteria bacterium]|nr:HEAT repeat domain-containing protein [Gammaproteobacteria bacterium]
DERWYVVRNVVLVLGQVNQPRAVTFLKKAIRHADPRVRREAIRSLGALRFEETDTLLLGLLDDPDPGLQIQACKALAATHSTMIFEALQKKIDESGLAGREPRMQRELLAAYARAGGDRALIRLSSIIKKRKLFGKSRRQQIKINAVYALGEIDSPSAVDFLRELAQATDESLSTPARQVLERSECSDTAEPYAIQENT